MGQPRRPRAADPPGATPAQVAAGIRRIIVGETFASATPTWISTVLGSCVSACIYDPERGVGGMNHFLLPEAGSDGLDSARYGSSAMDLLINQIMKLGGDRRCLVAKVFGAANAVGSADVARRNQAFIETYLLREDIAVRGSRLGGTRPIEVRFETASGRALCRPLRRWGSGLAVLERRGLEQAARAVSPAHTSVTLFDDE
jgi:chemotaxis receptor (MCP) glutamine deamidase CheD